MPSRWSYCMALYSRPQKHHLSHFASSAKKTSCARACARMIYVLPLDSKRFLSCAAGGSARFGRLTGSFMLAISLWYNHFQYKEEPNSQPHDADDNGPFRLFSITLLPRIKSAHSTDAMRADDATYAGLGKHRCSDRGCCRTFLTSYDGWLARCFRPGRQTDRQTLENIMHAYLLNSRTSMTDFDVRIIGVLQRRRRRRFPYPDLSAVPPSRQRATVQRLPSLTHPIPFLSSQSAHSLHSRPWTPSASFPATPQKLHLPIPRHPSLSKQRKERSASITRHRRRRAAHSHPHHTTLPAGPVNAHPRLACFSTGDP
ncbi:hypothetical protein IWX90DRAFT_181073 [Phyllosticta citrichinensis]|uniref:Uncharacterized protein n=1 Tax=Phyllosticta citrichinensis TaxID=1130410 RepID=A0ABR1XW63_9PEZI